VVGEDPGLRDPGGGDFRADRADGYGCRVWPAAGRGVRLAATPSRGRPEAAPPRARPGRRLEVGGPVTEDTLWDAALVRVVAPVTVSGGATLTIAAGARVEFAGFWGITVTDGSLQAVGAPDARIRLVSDDPAAWAPDADPRGAWSGLVLDRIPASRDTTRLAWCEISHAKALPGRRGELADGSGGAVSVIGAAPVRLSHCELHHNLGERGGAVALRLGAAPVLVNNLIHHNHALLRGAGLWVSYSDPVLVHTTCLANTTAAPDAFVPTGAIDHTHAHPRHVGGITWGNPTSYHAGVQIREPKAALTRFCLVEDWSGGEGCLTGDPGLELTGEPYAAPLPDAPVVDAGSSAAAAPDLPARDLAGRPRCVGAAPDLGAYELAAATVAPAASAPGLRVAAAPNPCNPRTRITWRQPRAGRAIVTVYDLAGRRVRSLDAGRCAAGRHGCAWDGTDQRGRRAPAGLYLVRVRAVGRTGRAMVTVVP
jgi:hypothetical protein